MLTHFIQNISSYDGNVLLAAVISLLLVILFVLLLHIYAKWFLQQARDRRRLRRTTNSISVLPHVLRPPRFHPFAFDITTAGYSSKGLDPSIIASIPLFVYSKKQQKEGDGGGGFEFEFDCVICLSGFEENEIGRCLTKCGHGFHVECIDMWLSSHSNCPICRAPVVAAGENSGNDCGGGGGSDDSERAGVELVEIVVGGGDDVDQGSRLNNGVIGDGAANRERGGDHDHGGGEPECSAAEALGCSLKRMLSRKRSDQCCCKVFSSSSNSVNNSGSQDSD